MPKTCEHDGCGNPIWSRKTMRCKVHQPKKSPTNKKTGNSLKRKPLKKVSPKMVPMLERYRKKRDNYLKETPYCEVHDCGKPSNNLHHKWGRKGYADDWARENNIPLLEDERYFMACCETCHPQRIHENPIWARENNYLK